MNNLYKPACVSTKKFPPVYWRVCVYFRAFPASRGERSRWLNGKGIYKMNVRKLPINKFDV